MNTNQLKRFAQSARTQLMLQVAARLEYVLRTDTAELREKTDSLRQLQEALNADGRETLIEKVAYTWFNRFVALRFMDVNDYQPLGIRLVTPGDNRTTPQLLEEAKQGIIADELPVNRTEIMELLDGLKPSANAQNEAYKLLLTGACNHLSSIFPFLFERINDYTELLMPDDLVTERSFLKELREGMDADDCREVEIIGWLYQFYISEKKDAVFASKSSVKKEDIPAATQLFTPRWIVEYMVQNTVGKLWLQNRPTSRLRQHMPYYIESETTTDFLQLSSIEELRLLDQACGSGHILVYGFELLYRIYEEEGYNPSDIPKLIIEHNLYGFEIDERAAQLAGFALMMKARSYHRRFFRKEVKPNILCYADLKLSADATQELFAQLNLPYPESLQTDLEHIRQSTNLGSLIRPITSLESLVELRENLEIKTKTADLFTKPALMAVQEAVAQLIPLAGKYHCVVDNPPYMGGGNMNKELGDYVKKHYPDSKADLMACFMEAGLSALHPAGMLGMINQHSWMFLSSYEKLRTKLIDSIQFDTLLHLGPRTFPEIGGEVVQNASFTFLNLPASVKGSYVRLVDFENSELKKEKTLEAVRDRECGWFYKANQKDFEKIPGGPIGYWLSERTYDIYQNSPTLKSVAYPRQGLATTNNELFLRYWSEVCFTKVGFGLNPNSEFRLNYKWFPLNKGGSFRKWYGNNFYVINFENNGKTICEYIDQTPGVKVKSNGRVINRDKYFCEGLTWSTISSGSLAMRFSPTGSIFETKGGMCFLEDRSLTFEVLGYLNSKISKYFLLVLSPTLDFHEGPLSKLPILAEPLNSTLTD